MFAYAARAIAPLTNLFASSDGKGHTLAPNGVIELSNISMLILGSSLLLVFLVSQKLELHVERPLAVGAVRCYLQLSVLGLVLVPILSYNYPAFIVTYVFFMLLVASVEAAARPPYVFNSIVLVCFTAISTAVISFGTFTFFIVIKTGLDAQYVIPITGMITGTSMSAVSVTMSNIVTEFAERRNNMEVLLALGATRWEAAIGVIRSSIKLSLTPLLTLLSVTGLVCIPGMSTFLCKPEMRFGVDLIRFRDI